jgi:hypothetical protein
MLEVAGGHGGLLNGNVAIVGNALQGASAERQAVDPAG